MTERPSPMGLALEWVGRIFAVSLIMILPGLGGQWLDRTLDTKLFTLLGFGLGLTVGFTALLAMTRSLPGTAKNKKPPKGPGKQPDTTDRKHPPDPPPNA